MKEEEPSKANNNERITIKAHMSYDKSNNSSINKIIGNVGKSNNTSLGVKLNKTTRIYIFVLLALTSISLNMDHGTIPAASNEIMKELKIEEATLGTFGSLVYMGNLIGALFLIKVIDITNRKKLSFFSTLFNAMLIYSFTQITNVYMLFVNRILVGIMQSYITIYFPVWIDQFGMRSWKTLMLSLFNITSPLGVLIGFVLTMTVKWKTSYTIQVVILTLLSLGYLLFDCIYFSKDLYILKKKNTKSQKNKDKNIDNSSVDNSTDFKSDSNISNDSDANQNLDDSIFIEQIRDQKESVYQRTIDIFSQPVFIFSCIAITTLLFISTAIIFWAPNYAETVLKADHTEVLTVFILVCVTGPVLGIIIGGAVVQKICGGYEGKHSSTICLIFASLAFLSGATIHNIDSLYSFGLCLWAVLFFGGAVIPNIQGIMISSLNPDLRAAGNSISNIMQNLLGFLPAPFIYGVIYKFSKDYDKKLAFTCTLYYAFVGVIFITLSLYVRFKKFSEDDKNHLHSEINITQEIDNKSNSRNTDSLKAQSLNIQNNNNSILHSNINKNNSDKENLEIELTKKYIQEVKITNSINCLKTGSI